VVYIVDTVLYTMGETSASSSPLAGNQRRKSRKIRTTNTKKMKALTIAVITCTVFCYVSLFNTAQVFQDAQVLIALQAETPLDVPVERANESIFSTDLPILSLTRIPTARPPTTRQQAVIADLRMLPAVPVLVEDSKNATTSASASATATATSDAHSMIPNTPNKTLSQSKESPTSAGAKKTLSQSDEPPRPHPHAGARDADGNWGYIADVTRIRRWMLQRYRETAGANATVSSSPSSPSSPSLVLEAANGPFPPSSYLPLTANETEKVCSVQPGMGHEGTHGWNVTIKVVLDGPNPLPPLDQSGKKLPRITIPEPNGVSKGKILCGIYSFHKNAHRIQGISETWGWRCDGFLPVSTVTIDDPAIQGYGSVHVPHFGTEKYRNMWQKTRSILTYMYDNYFDDYEYFYLAGDDTHVIVENLRRYLYTVEQTHDVATEPLFMGALTFRGGNVTYNDGGAGYILNRVALKRLVLEVFPICEVEKESSAEDMFVAKCFKEIQIHPLHTVDAQGRQRFINRPTDQVGSFDGTLGFASGMATGWAKRYGRKIGADIVSESSIIFHLRSDELAMKRHHAIIYDSCPNGTVLHAAVQKGRYARGNSTAAVVARR
jgi:hypothetical protein